MPDPFKTQIRDRLWELVEASPTITTAITAADRLSRAGEGWLRELMQKGPADYPQLDITNGRYTFSAWQTEPAKQITYQLEESKDYDSTKIGDVLIRRRLVYFIKLTHTDLNPQALDALDEAVQIGILRGGPALGLAFVMQAAPLEAQLPKEVADTNGLKKQQIIMQMPVLIEHPAITLLGA